VSIIKRERELVAVTAVGESDRDWFVCLTPVGFVWPEITASTRAWAGRLTPIPKDRVPQGQLPRRGDGSQRDIDRRGARGQARQASGVRGGRGARRWRTIVATATSTLLLSMLPPLN